MFSTLENNWDHSARGRATLASFSIQLLCLSLVVAISMLWIDRPPQVRWLQMSAPTLFTPIESSITPASPRHFAAATVSNLFRGHIVAPQLFPPHAAKIDDSILGPPAPNLPDVDVRSGRGSRDAVPFGLGDNLPVVIPARPTPNKPLVVSNLGEGSLLRHVQPIYPAIAREARVQGSVELRATISKTGLIENLVVVRGHPMLATAAVEAVRQWRYRPYLLNNQPVEVETEVTVNFLLSGG